MKPSELEMELLFQILRMRADLNGLMVALDRRMNNPQQTTDWRDDFREGQVKARAALLHSLEKRDATLHAHLRDFLDVEN